MELSIINLINHRFWMILGYPHDYGNLHISNHQISGPADGEITGWRRFVSHGMIRVLMLSMTSECLPSKKQQIATISIGYGSIPIKPIFSGMNIHLPAIWGSLGTRVLTHPQIATISILIIDNEETKASISVHQFKKLSLGQRTLNKVVWMPLFCLSKQQDATTTATKKHEQLCFNVWNWNQIESSWIQKQWLWVKTYCYHICGMSTQLYQLSWCSLAHSYTVWVCLKTKIPWFIIMSTAKIASGGILHF